jgi:hypothetical protein
MRKFELAFPLHIPQQAGDNHYGMSLRDWFAGQVIGAIAAHDLAGNNTTDGPKNIAKASYLIADAMLEARKS